MVWHDAGNLPIAQFRLESRDRIFGSISLRQPLFQRKAFIEATRDTVLNWRLPFLVVGRTVANRPVSPSKASRRRGRPNPPQQAGLFS